MARSRKTQSEAPKMIAGLFLGVVLMAGVLHTAGAGVVFAGGAVVGALPLLIAVSSPGRLRRASRFLATIADTWDKPAAQPPPPLPVAVDPVAADVASALINQGTTPRVAETVAREAAKTNRSFDSAYRAALLLVPRTRRTA